MAFGGIKQLIKGKYYDFSSIEFGIDGGQQPRVTDINYSQKLDPGVLRGTSAKPYGRTRGTYEASGSFTIYKEDFEDLKLRLAAGGEGYMMAEFTITVVYSEMMMTNEDVLMQCRIVSEENGHSAGNDPLVVRVDLSVMEIMTNGLSAVYSNQ